MNFNACMEPSNHVWTWNNPIHLSVISGSITKQRTFSWGPSGLDKIFIPYNLWHHTWNWSSNIATVFRKIKKIDLPIVAGNRFAGVLSADSHAAFHHHRSYPMANRSTKPTSVAMTLVFFFYCSFHALGSQNHQKYQISSDIWCYF